MDFEGVGVEDAADVYGDEGDVLGRGEGRDSEEEGGGGKRREERERNVEYSILVSFEWREVKKLRD